MRFKTLIEVDVDGDTIKGAVDIAESLAQQICDEAFTDCARVVSVKVEEDEPASFEGSFGGMDVLNEIVEDRKRAMEATSTPQKLRYALGSHNELEDRVTFTSGEES